MKISNNIFYLIGLAIILILINTVFFLHQVNLNKKNHSFTTTSYAIIHSANTLLSTIRDAETGQRGFIITNDTNYLKPFYNARQNLDSVYKDFNKRTSVREYATVDMQLLRGLISDRMNEINETVHLKQTGNTSEARNVILSDQGRTNMQGILKQINNLINEERQVLLQHERDADEFTLSIKTYTMLSNFVLLSIAIASIFNINDNRLRIKNLFKEIEDKNKLLEQQKNNLQQLSQDLIKQNGELERFAYVASHDLRAPVANLEALLNLYKEAKNTAEQKTLVETMNDVTDNLSSKLNDLVELLHSKHEAALLNETLSLHKIYEKVKRSLAAEIRQTNARIQHDFSEAPTITYPKSYMESILQNLISNALKYRHPDRRPEINVKSFKQNGQTFMVIADNGIGIDLNKHGSQLFGLYKTFHANKNSKGIGLYITRAQILSLGGKIDIDSKPGEGTRFTIAFNS
ncbi:MAG TPA: CHASE3 domain-containing protein [Sphingobacteriaceae bacterium]